MKILALRLYPFRWEESANIFWHFHMELHPIPWEWGKEGGKTNLAMKIRSKEWGNNKIIPTTRIKLCHMDTMTALSKIHSILLCLLFHMKFEHVHSDWRHYAPSWMWSSKESLKGFGSFCCSRFRPTFTPRTFQLLAGDGAFSPSFAHLTEIHRPIPLDTHGRDSRMTRDASIVEWSPLRFPSGFLQLGKQRQKSIMQANMNSFLDMGRKHHRYTNKHWVEEREWITWN